jgi:very-short-patch-repair endonuclease
MEHKEHFLKYPSSSIPKARALRRRMTDAEKKFWSLVRNNKLGIKFKRQVPAGPYFLDFFAHKGKVGVELDGSQHYTIEGKEYDKERDKYLSEHGILILRFTNKEFLTNQDGVLNYVYEKIKERQTLSDLTPDPSLERRGE